MKGEAANIIENLEGSMAEGGGVTGVVFFQFSFKNVTLFSLLALWAPVDPIKNILHIS